jgi:SAM-dependent methyltransferase
MHISKYIKYFFYLATNWNIRIAWHITRREIKGEKKYGINTTGADELKDLEEKGIDISHATIYMPASYDMLELVLDQLDEKKIRHFLDIGCGKGRVMCVAAAKGIDKVTGVDFSKEFCAAAKENLETVKQNHPALEYTVLNTDAFYFPIPDDADCIFLFNPFDEVIMSGVAENIEMSLERAPREISIVYLNPLNKELFLSNGFKEVFYIKKLNYLEGSILKKYPADAGHS